ncbi:MAG: OsmC family protein [Candidatus Omnitrophota bacterium]
MPSEKKISYSHKLRWQEGKIGKLSGEGKGSFDIATPVDFGGPSGFWGPEDLFVASVNSCIMTTFLFFLQKKRIKLLGYQSVAEGFVGKNQGKLIFKEVIVKPTIFISQDNLKDQTSKIIELSKKHCLISNSINCPVKLEYQIEKR